MIWSSPMRGTQGIQRSDLKQVCVLIGIIAALCFSAGEGLRLSPFPAGSVTRIDLPAGQLNTSGSCETSPTEYGPIHLPTRTQARSKHKVFDVDCLPATVAVNGSPYVRDLLAPGEASTLASFQLISRARDRAPPSSSTS